MSSLLPALAGMAMALNGSAAQAADPDSGGLWHKACRQGGGRQECHVEQFVISQPSNAVVLQVRFALMGQDGGRMAIRAPLGSLLQPGLRLSIDGAKSLVLPFERCTPEGCDASAILDRSALAKIGAGKTMNIVLAVSDKLAPAIPIRLEGLADALKALSD